MDRKITRIAPFLPKTTRCAPIAIDIYARVSMTI